MTSNQSSYRQIFKATSIFGGVQVFNIIIALIRGKALALLIGTAGMGLNGLLMSGLNLIKVFSGLGLEQSAIRDISMANATGEKQKLFHVYTIFKRWIWITAGIAVVLTIGLSSVLSRLSFGDNSHSWSFVWLSSTFVFGALMGGIYTLMRGTLNIKLLAKANIFGATAGLLAVLPIFYFYGIQGVVPAIIVSAMVGYFVSIYFKRKMPLQTIELPWRETFSEGKGMILLGISLSLSALLSTAAAYILNTFITRVGSLSDLGLYNAGMSIMSGYVGLVFTAMSNDYFPRLSGIIDDEIKWRLLVNQQAELLILILGPILALILATAPIFIKILLSSEFLPAVDFLIWAVLAVLIKALVWVQGFVIIAKGKNKLFLLTELLGNIFFLSLNMLFFRYYNIKGLGISMLLGYGISLIIMLIVMKWKFNFILSRTLVKLTLFFMGLLSLSLASIYLLDYPKAYYSGALLFLIATVLCIFVLNKRMDLKALFIFAKNKFF